MRPKAVPAAHTSEDGTLRRVETTGRLVLGGAAATVLLVILEGRRQARVYGRPSGRPNRLGVALLDLQRHLRPDRQVGAFIVQVDGEEEQTDEQLSGDDNPHTHWGSRARRL